MELQEQQTQAEPVAADLEQLEPVHLQQVATVVQALSFLNFQLPPEQ
jgi:hypothetical protein